MKKTVVLYDPMDDTGLNGTGFHVLDIDDTLETYHSLIKCDTITGSTIGRFSIFADDEALLKDPLPPVSVVDGSFRPLIFGRIVFVGHPDRDGETLSLTPEEVETITAHFLIPYRLRSTGALGFAISDVTRS